MEIEQYLNTRKILYDHLLDFIDNQDEPQSDYTNLISDITNQNITENKNEFEKFLHLLVVISSNHHRYSNFYNKIDQILSYLSTKITQTFSNSEIFDIFSKNKRVLHFLIKNDVFKYDKDLMKSIENRGFHLYLAETNESDEKHSQKKEIGENDLYICDLIRNDSIDEFIVYINKNDYPLTNKIKPSIYDTNTFIQNRKVTILEYAFFFGSIRIITYILNKGIKLSEKLWPFAIHSNNAELINLLEENHLIPQNNKLALKYLEEAIMCHHNNIASYIQDNYVRNDINVFYKNIQIYSFRYVNYAKMAECQINNDSFLYACQYNYIELVKFLLNDVNIDINYTRILKINFFY